MVNASSISSGRPTCSVEVEDRVEGARVPVEEVLVVDERVGVAVLQDALVRQTLHRQPTQPRSETRTRRHSAETILALKNRG